MADAAPGASAQAEQRSPDAAAAPPLLSTLQKVWQELPGLISDRVELLSLELRHAGITLAQVVVLVLAAAILAVTAWLVMWGGIVVALVTAGMHTALALLVAGLTVGCWNAWHWVSKEDKAIRDEREDGDA